MKILGVGLSKTGTSSLHRALQILGYSSLHFDEERLVDVLDGSNPTPDFRRYDDVDAVLDLPTAVFYEELLAAYPECRCILTVRDVDSWWRSVSRYFNDRFPVDLRRRTALGERFHRFSSVRIAKSEHYMSPEANRFRARLRRYVYGSATAHEFLYKKRYLEHNDAVRRRIPSDRLLVMDITAGDGWEPLCGFLDLPVPEVPFPRENAWAPSAHAASGAA
jgi:hypothetical protein